MIRAYFEMLLAEETATRELPRDARMGDPVGKMKQFATWFTHGVPGGAKLRAAIYHSRTGDEVLAQVEQFFMARVEAGDHADAEPAEIPDNEPAGLADAILVCD
jgi:tRNA-dihydrouridine synthase